MRATMISANSADSAIMDNEQFTSITTFDLLSLTTWIKFSDGKCYNIHHKFQRAIAVSQLFAYWTRINKYDIDFRIIVNPSMSRQQTDFNSRIFENVIAFELIYASNHLTKALSFIACHSETLCLYIMKSPGTICDYIGLLEILSVNRLILRHIFKMQQIIWKPFISALICLMITYNTYVYEQKCTKLSWNTKFWSIVSTILIKCMKYWKFKHFEFAIQQQLIRCFYRYHSKFNLIAWNIDMIAQTLCNISKIDHMNKSELLKQFMQSTTEDQNINLDYYKLFKTDNLPWTTEQIVCALNRSNESIHVDITCAWLLCKKSLHNISKLYKCKRCRMVEYCCRNHQKKHWKYIHSQQCRVY
eukprot:388631_1